MRDINFRGIDLKGRMQFGDLVNNAFHGVSIVEVIETPHTMSDPCGDTICKYHSVIPETVGQFVGLKDKNGVDVYEGDVILIHWGAGSDVPEIISYDEKYGYWKYGNNPICELIPDTTCDGYIFEVIGNIYQSESGVTNA